MALQLAAMEFNLPLSLAAEASGSVTTYVLPPMLLLPCKIAGISTRDDLHQK